MNATHRWGWAAGIAAGALGLGAGEMAAALFGRTSPVQAVADLVIDNVPHSVERWAISNFGTNDKVVLGWGIVVVVLLIAARVGSLAVKQRTAAIAGAVGLGLVGAFAATIDGVGGWSDAVPALIAAVVGGGALVILSEQLRWSPEPADTNKPVVVDRRVFLGLSAGALGGAAVLAGASRPVARGAGATASRGEVAKTGLPRPVKALPPQPAGVQVDVAGVNPWTTPNADFYRIDTAFVVPRIDVNEWRLSIDGLVKKPRTFTYKELLARPMIEADVTLMCVSNEVGGDLVGNARWLGIPLAELLEEAGVDPSAEQIFSTSADGWNCGFPISTATDGRNAMVALGMNGEPLPFQHGFPARLVVPGIYGYVSATKWLTIIEALKWSDARGYWIPRGWSRDAPVKTSSRIDVPRNRASVAAGPVAVAGVAWAQHRGIAKVEVQVDDGPWNVAELALDGNVDCWRQWKWTWDAKPGTYVLQVRATDNNGSTQSADRVDVAPNGAEGYHRIAVRVQ